MKTKPYSLILSTLCTLLLTGLTAAFASDVVWSLRVIPADAGLIVWSHNLPSGSGSTHRAASVRFSSGALLDLTFSSHPGYKLVSVRKNTEEIIHWLDANSHYRFGPVGNPHSIVAVFAVDAPTGTFSGVYQEGEGLSPVVDMTGNYAGAVPNSDIPRNYNVDVAMDESGKVVAMGIVTGLRNAGGGMDLGGTAGSVRSVQGEPRASLKGSFTGTLDGKPVRSSGSASGPAQPQGPSANPSLEGVAAGTSVLDQQRHVARPATGGVSLPPAHAGQFRKGWGFTVQFAEKVDSRGRTYLESTGLLRLANGGWRYFAPKKVRYSVARGYIVNYSPAYVLDDNLDLVLDARGRPVRDRRCKLGLRQFQLNKVSGQWQPVDGTLRYQFQGQKGEGPAANFFD
jgi:hypothetical protein